MKNHDQKKRVALGLSGGVDSAVCAHLLIKQGYDVTGVYIECWHYPGCRAEQDRKDALQIALHLGIPLKILNFKKDYKNEVMTYFLREYKAGRTPNPDVMCNRIIKFGLFYDWAIKQEEFDDVATGHYAQIISDDNQLYLATAIDNHKDQTYFLHQLKSNQLKYILFPLGKITKKEVRQLAKTERIHVADKKDSVGICFVGDINVRQFLKENLGKKPGMVVDIEANIIGKHQGLWFYTVGQRQGFKIDTKAVQEKTNFAENKHHLPPLYVIDKNINNNQLVVGPKTQTKRSSFKVKNIHWITPQKGKSRSPKNLFVRIRHTGQLIVCSLQTSNQEYTVNLQQSVSGVAEGQSAVFYQTRDSQDEVLFCLGGGVISR